jgi:TMEM175 potassium channel family protein
MAAARVTAKKSETVTRTDRNQPGTGRIETFSDSVFAIAITIMVLDLKFPDQVADWMASPAILLPLLPKFVSYVMSFVVIGIMWINHHQIMPTAPLATRHLMWWNNNLLFWTSLIPLVTRFLGDHPLLPLAVALYGLVLGANLLSFALLRLYIVRMTETGAALDAHHTRILRRNLFGAALYGASVPLAFVSVFISMVIFAAVPAMFFLPEPLPKKLPETADGK